MTMDPARDSQAELTRKTVKGVLWSSLSFAGSKGITFLATMVLARLLAPDDFGLMALGLVAIGYLETFGSLGVGNFVIYKQGEEEKTANLAFTLGLTVNTLLAIAGFLLAPWIADFFNQPSLTGILRALSVTLLLMRLGSIHEARLKKSLRFRRTFYPELGKTLAKAITSITLAWLGFGVWSLVAGQIAGSVVVSLIYWLVSGWRPHLAWDWTVSKGMLGYSSQIILVEMMGMLQNNIDYLIIGKRLGSEPLGYYTMAFRIPELLIINICVIVSNALFPAYSQLQSDREALKKGFLVTLQYVSLYTIPVGIGLSVLSAAFIPLAFGDGWQTAVPLMQALAIYALFYSLSFNAGDVYKATGRPDILNKLSIFELLFIIPLLLFASNYGILYVALAQVIGSATLMLVKLLFIKRLIGLRLADVVSALRPAVLSGLLMLAVLMALTWLLKGASPWVHVLILPVTGGLVYLSSIWLIHPQTARQALQLLRGIWGGKRSQVVENA
jgi:O-antigen/teichoic acid export membrane protein